MGRQHLSVSALDAELGLARRRIVALESELERQSRSEIGLTQDDLFRKAVLAHAAEGICVCHSVPTHPYIEFTVWNPRMTELTGYSLDQINRLGWHQTRGHCPREGETLSNPDRVWVRRSLPGFPCSRAS